MADKKQNTTSESVANDKPLTPSAIKDAPTPINDVPDIPLKFGEILLAPILDGKEGDPFKVSINTYRQYYSDEKKFVVKKKFK